MLDFDILKAQYPVRPFFNICRLVHENHDETKSSETKIMTDRKRGLSSMVPTI